MQRYLFGGDGEEILQPTTRLERMKLYFSGDFLPTFAASLPLSPLLFLWNVGVDARILQAQSIPCPLTSLKWHAIAMWTLSLTLLVVESHAQSLRH